MSVPDDTAAVAHKYRRPLHQTPTASDLVNRDFTREAPDLLWVTDPQARGHPGRHHAETRNTGPATETQCESAAQGPSVGNENLQSA
jgi:hypothetical protein